jgi:hypothetical protein
MKIQSLGLQSDLIFTRFSGLIEDRGDYVVVKTPDNPEYHWGNFLIFNQAPRQGSLKQWTDIFNTEFSYYTEAHHFVFAWDITTSNSPEYQEFLESHFELDSTTVLTSQNLNPPPHINTDLKIRALYQDQDWEDALNLQILCSDAKYQSDGFSNFKKKQMANYRKMVDSKRGLWFGAFLEGKLVGDLGIFYEGNVARYQNVGTHPDFRRQGICGTLVYQTGLMAFQEFKVTQLVMLADTDYHAARIYESVGFKPTESLQALSWWKGS